MKLLDIEGLMSYAARALSARAYSISELSARLKKRAAQQADVDEVLDRLKRNGVLDDRRLAVLTNKPGDMSRAILEGLGVADRFFRIYGAGDIDARKDFGSTSNYLTHGEFNPAFSIGLDILSLFPKAK